MPLNPRGLQCETLSVLASPDILELAEDGGKGRRLLRVSV